MRCTEIHRDTKTSYPSEGGTITHVNVTMTCGHLISCNTDQLGERLRRHDVDGCPLTPRPTSPAS